jgi:uncharacterized metal-binding protein
MFFLMSQQGSGNHCILFIVMVHKLWFIQVQPWMTLAQNSRVKSLIHERGRRMLVARNAGVLYFIHMHFNASVRANFHQLSKHLRIQIIACKICGLPTFAILKQHLVINLITATLCQPVDFVCKQRICSSSMRSLAVLVDGKLLNAATGVLRV